MATRQRHVHPRVCRQPCARGCPTHAPHHRYGARRSGAHGELRRRHRVLPPRLAPPARSALAAPDSIQFTSTRAVFFFFFERERGRERERDRGASPYPPSLFGASRVCSALSLSRCRALLRAAAPGCSYRPVRCTTDGQHRNCLAHAPSLSCCCPPFPLCPRLSWPLLLAGGGSSVGWGYRRHQGPRGCR